MAMTTQQQTDAYRFFVIAFGAAPGVTYMNQIADAYAAGMTTKQIVNVYTTKPQFTAIYPSFYTNTQFANALVENVVGSSASAAAKTQAKSDVEAALNAGWSRGDVIYQIFNNLADKPTTDADWGNTAKMFANKVAVAQYATEVKLVDSTNLATLQSIVANVTATTDVSTTAALDAVLAGAATGQTFTLTAGADTPAATSGNDTINALSINAAGTAATTFSAFDVIDGGAGTDTLNIYTTGTENIAFPATATVKNVEIVNVYNAAAAAAFGDASKFEGVTQLWQNGAAASVTKLAATTTAGFKNVDANVSVAPTDAAASVAIALDNYGEGRTITVDGSAAAATLNAVTVSGTVKDTNADGTVAATTIAVTTGKDVESVTVTTAVKTTLTVTESAASGATKDVRTVDVSASTGAVTFAGSVISGTSGSVATIKGGSGDDTLTIVTATLKDDASTAADETVSALVDGGAGKDDITINTTGTGTTTVNAGDGNDTVTLTADGSGKLTVNLGAGNDIFKGAGSVAGTDVIDGGDGSDTLLLNMVGAANIGAFHNFEVFDAAGLAKTLDLDILATKNTVTKITASADVGASAVLTNLGAGVGYRVTGDTAIANALTLTQKTAGALTVTLDIDETGTTAATTASTARDAAVVALNATSVKAVFDSAFVGAATGAGDNATSLTITGTKATSLEVVSGGANASNTLLYTGGDDATTGKGDLLTTVTISGDRAVNFDYTAVDATEITSINASALTGGLTFALNDLKAGGTLTLGSGDDVITAQTGVASASTVAAMRAISGIEKGTAENSTIQSNYDVIKLAGAVQAADVAATATHTVKDGLFTFNGTGPATLDAAVAAVAGVIGANEAVVFEYVGNSYIYAEGATDGGADDVLIKLTGVTGLAGLDDVNAAGGNLYVF